MLARRPRAAPTSSWPRTTAAASSLNVSAHRRFLSRAAAYAIRRGAGLDAQHRLVVLPRLPRRGRCAPATRATATTFIRECGLRLQGRDPDQAGRGWAPVAEVPVSLDWSRREGESKMRVLPTIGGYARLMARQVAARGARA